MSIPFALAVGHLGVSGIELPGLGFSKFSPNDASFGSAPPDTTTQAGKLSTLTRGGAQHGWSFMPTFITPAEVRKVCIGVRFTGLNKNQGDANTVPIYIWIAGTYKYYLFQALSGPIVPATECYVEVEIDRDTGNITGYIDGVSVGVVGTLAATPNTGMSTTGWTVGIANRNYGGGATVLSSDIYVSYKDGVYPEGRLGPVKIKSVPVRVSSVVGIDKSAAEMETIANTKLVNANGQPLTKGTVAKTNAAAAEVNFSLDLTGIDVSRQMAASIFVGAQRTGSQSVSATIERVLDGVTKSEQAVDLTTRSADRLSFSTSLPARTASTPRSLNDISHKLKIVEA